MKYFTKEIWAGHNGQGPLSRQEAQKLGERNTRDYLSQLDHLQPRLSKQTYQFFKTESLHDGRLLSFIAGDDIDYLSEKSRRFDTNARKTQVRLQVLGADLDMLYVLTYKKVKRIWFDFPTDQPLFYSEGGHIADWGYDELTAADDNYLRHEVLFSSGAIILIEFKIFSYHKKPCEGTRYPQGA